MVAVAELQDNFLQQRQTQQNENNSRIISREKKSDC